MRTNIDINGFSSLARKLGRIVSGHELLAALEQSSMEVKQQAITNLNDGIAPDSSSGQLEQSIIMSYNFSAKQMEVGTNLSYGWHLEFGTRYIPASPWLAPDLQAAQPKIKEHFQKAVRMALKG